MHSQTGSEPFHRHYGACHHWVRPRPALRSNDEGSNALMICRAAARWHPGRILVGAANNARPDSGKAWVGKQAMCRSIDCCRVGGDVVLVKQQASVCLKTADRLAYYHLRLTTSVLRKNVEGTIQSHSAVRCAKSVMYDDYMYLRQLKLQEFRHPGTKMACTLRRHMQAEVAMTLAMARPTIKPN